MTESTLSIGYPELIQAVGRFLGFGGTSGNWSADELDRVDDIVQTGYRQLLFPPPLPGEQSIHVWSFMNPVAELSVLGPVSVAAATGTYDASTYTVIVDDAAGSPFSADMVGEEITITDVGTYTIATYTDADTISILGDNAFASKAVSVVGSQTYDLPDDFGGLVGRFTYQGEDYLHHPIPTVSEGQIRAWRARPRSSGKIQFAAIRPKAIDATDGQRFELMVFPEPDADATLDYRYNVMVNKLSTSYPYPLGGMAHGQTLIESCLAAAEQDDDEIGVHTEAFFKVRLPASVMMDRQISTPQYLGYNGDGSDSRAPKSSHNDLVYYTDPNGTVWPN